jgi:hypothetical protein
MSLKFKPQLSGNTMSVYDSLNYYHTTYCNNNRIIICYLSTYITYIIKNNNLSLIHTEKQNIKFYT